MCCDALRARVKDKAPSIESPQKAVRPVLTQVLCVEQNQAVITPAQDEPCCRGHKLNGFLRGCGFDRAKPGSLTVLKLQLVLSSFIVQHSVMSSV